MADDDTVIESNDSKPAEKPAAPVLDAEAIRAAVGPILSEEISKLAVRSPEPYPAPAPPAARPVDPVRDMLEPYLAPEIARARLETLLAEDKSDFYSSWAEDPDYPDDPKERGEVRALIERRSKDMVASGVPFKRDDIWKHYKGENFGTLHEKATARRAKKLEDAEAAGGVGPSGGRRAASGGDPHVMKDEELDRSLEGVSF